MIGHLVQARPGGNAIYLLPAIQQIIPATPYPAQRTASGIAAFLDKGETLLTRRPSIDRDSVLDQHFFMYNRILVLPVSDHSKSLPSLRITEKSPGDRKVRIYSYNAV